MSVNGLILERKHKMKKIVLFCANGFTTAMMAKKLKEAIDKQGLDYDSAAYPYSEIDDRGPEADIILLGPQVRYNLKHVKEKFPNTPSVVLDMATYAKMDGEKIFAQVREILEK